jgi:hypothetical protein
VAQVGRGRVCAARYRWNKTAWIAATDGGDPQIVTWEALIASITAKTLIAGEIDEAAQTLLDSAIVAGRKLHLAPPAWCVRRAAFLADLAIARANTDPPTDPAAVVPIYVNQPGVPHP